MLPPYPKLIPCGSGFVISSTARSLQPGPNALHSRNISTMVEFVFAAESMWAKLCFEHGVAAAIGGYVDGNARFGWGLIRFGVDHQKSQHHD